MIGTIVVFLSMVFLALPLTIIVSTFSKVRIIINFSRLRFQAFLCLLLFHSLQYTSHKKTIAINKVALGYDIVRGLCFRAVIL